jgi:tellurite resistance protein TehA-like permease
MVSGDATGTAASVLAHQMLLRTSVVVWLLGMAIWIVMALVLCRLFNGVSKPLAWLLVIFVAVSAGIGMLNELNNLAAILVLRGSEFAGVLTQSQRDAAAMLFLRLHGQGNAVNEMLWGCGCCRSDC